MKVVLFYVMPMINTPVFGPLAQRWAQTYMEHPGGESDHEIVVCLNGGNGVGPYQRKLFDPLPVTFVEHNNYGKDLGAFQMAADRIECDLIVFMGSFVNFYRPGWLDVIVREYENNGPAMYGAFCYPTPSPHIRTTIFWCPPELFNAYPVQIGDRDRYPAEHGSNSITLWARKMGFETFMVNFDGCFPGDRWPEVRPDNVLVHDQHTKRDFGI